jgi:hypothetical protein
MEAVNVPSQYFMLLFHALVRLSYGRLGSPLVIYVITSLSLTLGVNPIIPVVAQLVIYNGGRPMMCGMYSSV